MTRRIDISWKTVLFISGFILLVWIILQILDILLLFFVGFIFMSALSPLVEKLASWKVPRVLAVILILLAVIAVIVGGVVFGVTPLVIQTSSLFQKFSDMASWLLQSNHVDLTMVQQELTKLSSQAIDITVGIFQNFISLVSVLVVTVYMLLDKEKLENYSTAFFGIHQEKAKRILQMIEEKLGAWMRGQVILSFLIGVSVYIGLTILGIDGALPLAIIAAFLEVVPVIGPIISAIPAVMIALTISPMMAAVVVGLYVVIQQLEGHLLVPQVMKRAVGLNPLLVILAISVGGRLLGIGGALLAVPLAVVIQLLLQEVLEKR